MIVARIGLGASLALASVGVALQPQSPRALPRDTLPARLDAPLPRGLPEAIDDPADNLFSPEKLALGRELFFDPILSVDRSVSCASCHQPEHGFADAARFSAGVGGHVTERNAPTLFNRAFGERQMWDGRSASLEEQALLPIENEKEMALPIDVALARLREDPTYAAMFVEAFEDGTTRDNLARALATFVRRIVLGDSPVDRFRAGEMTALSEEERMGLWLYESRARCWRCHGGPGFSDEGFHATGIGATDGEPEPGRAAITGDARDRGRFKTPTLRGLALTGPYMHDGSLATLEEVIEFYAAGGRANSNLDPLLEPLELDATERRALVAFLRALSR